MANSVEITKPLYLLLGYGNQRAWVPIGEKRPVKNQNAHERQSRKKMWTTFGEIGYRISTTLKPLAGLKPQAQPAYTRGPPRPKTGRQQCLHLGANPQPTSSTCWYPCFHPWSMGMQDWPMAVLIKPAPAKTGACIHTCKTRCRIASVGLTAIRGRSHQVDCWYPTGCLSRRSTSLPAARNNLLHTFICSASRAETSPPRNQ